PTAGSADPCAPVSASSVTPHVATLVALLGAHQVAPPSPTNGNVDVQKDAAGNPTRIDFNADGTALDYVDTFQYDASGRITRFDHNADGSANDYTETYQYDANLRMTRFDHNADGSANDVTET